MRRVVITGLGTVNALGPDVQSSWPRMLEGQNGIREIDFFDASNLAVRISGHVDYDSTTDFPGPDQRKLDPFTMWALRGVRRSAGATLSIGRSRSSSRPSQSVSGSGCDRRHRHRRHHGHPRTAAHRA